MITIITVIIILIIIITIIIITIIIISIIPFPGLKMSDENSPVNQWIIPLYPGPVVPSCGAGAGARVGQPHMSLPFFFHA
jgi:hypothetical protein